MLNDTGYDPSTGEWNDSLTGDYLWSSVNTREASPDVMTPYTWSGIRYGFSQMIMLPGYLPVGNICGRTYNNSSVGATVFQVIGGGRNPFDASSKELYGIDPNDVEAWNVPLVPTGLWDKARVLRNALRVVNNMRVAIKRMDKFLVETPDWCEEQHRRLPNLEVYELSHWVEDDLKPYVVKCFWGMVSSAIAQSNTVSKLRAELLRYVDPNDAIALLSNVSTEDDFLASLGIVAGLDRLRKGKISREDYVRQYGHRGPHEVELSCPRPAEDPNWIDQQLEEMGQSLVDVDALLDEQRNRHNQALEKLHKATPESFKDLHNRVREAAQQTRVREAGRSEGMRVMWVARAFAKRAGELLNTGDEIFFLELDEIAQVLQGKVEPLTTIPVRTGAYKRFSTLPLYPTIIMGQFDPYKWAADPNRRTDIYDPSQRIKTPFTKQVRGMAGSAGLAEGRVRILNTAEEGEGFQLGEILVAITTNVGWTPIFPRAAAVVTDVGAPLSHAAIVARELGIPAVVGCGNATAILKTGDRVRVDGSRGTVEILGR